MTTSRTRRNAVTPLGGSRQPRHEVAQVMDAARTLASEGGREGDLRLPENWRQQSLLLLKPQTAQGEPPRPE